jgi:regulator of RNase E activity RraB
VTISEPDREVLRQLADNGDHPAISRPVMHYFYGEREQLYDIAERLEKPGWEEVELAKGEHDFRLVATKITDLLDGSVERMMAEIADAVAGLEVTYDGWETSVEKPN